jgi:hypothetical protein
MVAPRYRGLHVEQIPWNIELTQIVFTPALDRFIRPNRTIVIATGNES